MLINMGFNICLNVGMLTGWDIRWLAATYGLGVFLWVLALSGSFAKSTAVILLFLDIGVVLAEIQPYFATVGHGQSFWNIASTSIVYVWLVSTVVVAGTVVWKSTVVARLRDQPSDLLTNPKKRFLLPIGTWATILLAAKYLGPFISTYATEAAYFIAGTVLVWGWVVLELPFYLAYRRLKRSCA
jgi:hypothetical protein